MLSSLVPVWSKVTVGGVNLNEIYPKIGQDGDPNDFAAVHKAVVDSAYEIIRMKGNTSWAIGLCCASLCSAIMQNKGVVIPVTTTLKVRPVFCFSFLTARLFYSSILYFFQGRYGIKEDIFTSVPCLIDSTGVSSIINLTLSPEEEKKLMKSVSTLQEIIKGIHW